MSKALILVDGMNIANRSMVAKQICTRFEKDSFEFYEGSDDLPAHMYVRMMAAVLNNDKHVIIENGWRSDYVMATMGQPAKIAAAHRRMLDRIALGCSAQVAYCHANDRQYAANSIKVVGNSYAQLKPMIDQMAKVWEESSARGLRVSKIDTSDNGYTMDIDLLMDKVDLFSGSNHGPGIGRWAPGEVILMVGDRHGPSIQPYKTDLNIAFCDMAKAGSSYWLSEQLDKAGIQEADLYWINAFDSVGEATEQRFVTQLNPKAIIALGDNAAKWCEGVGLEFEQFDHPQYHKRFHFHSPYPLITKLKELLNA